MDEQLGRRVGELRGALDRFRATPGWHDHLSDVPPLDIDLAAAQGRLRRLGELVSGVAAAFDAADRGGMGVRTLADRRIAPHVPEVDHPFVLVADGDRWIVSGTDHPDHIRIVDRDGRFVLVAGRFRDGRLVYEDEIVLSEAQAANLVIRSGRGNDVIEVPPSARLRVVVWTGDGDDTVGAANRNAAVRTGGGGAEQIFLGRGNDVAFGGAGDDEIHGGSGRDVIDGQGGDDVLVGGDGFDTLYGGRGDDVLVGGRGGDFLEGGRGADRLLGGAGDDVLSGGRGDDVLVGGDGDDRTFGGSGVDRIDGGHGWDVDVGEGADVARGVERRVTIELEGDPGSYAVSLPKPTWMSDGEHEAWLERIDSDLELIRSTPSGRAGLVALDKASRDSDSPWNPFDRDRVVVVVPSGAPDTVGGVRGPRVVEDLLDQGAQLPNGSYAAPPGHTLQRDAMVNYEASVPEALDDLPPVAVLYHELAHGWDQISGGTEAGDYTEVFFDAEGREIGRSRSPMAEINAVGLDLDGDGVIDTRANARGKEHPGTLTENALRDDLGWERRTAYRKGPEGAVDVEFEVDR
jgi:Ca2+-binding RTX toxin-like protein